MDNNGKNLPSKISLTLRIVVAAYILYLGYGLITSEEPKSFFIWAFAIFFVAISLFIGIMAGKALLTGRFLGGSADVTAEENSVDEYYPSSASNNNDELEEITDAEEIEGRVTDARIMGLYENSKIETASERDMEEV